MTSERLVLIFVHTGCQFSSSLFFLNIYGKYLIFFLRNQKFLKGMKDCFHLAQVQYEEPSFVSCKYGFSTYTYSDSGHNNTVSAALQQITCFLYEI